MHGAEGPEVALAALRLPSGARSWANCRDGVTMEAMMKTEHVGRNAEVAPDHSFAV